MEQPQKLLADYTDEEKGAYLGAIASIATADHAATEEEIEYLKGLSQSAGLSAQHEEAVIRAASELTGEELKQCLEVVKKSDLRFSLVTDLISFAQADQAYSEEEKARVEKIAQYLNIDQHQFSLLNQFVDKTASTQNTPEEVAKPGFLASLGLEDKLRSAGINTASLTKGLLGIAGPMLLASLFNRGIRRNTGGGFGPFGNGGFTGMGGGGFGSLISMLNGRRGYRSSGGLLSRIFGSLF